VNGRMTRASHHVEPQGALQIARHYVRDLVYGANDGIITTFAVVAGVSGGSLSRRPLASSSPMRRARISQRP
jgi:VIT1/CCC1 family predicted Fe2+/Mn2+ transporter